MQYRKMPVPFVYVLLVGVSLGLVLAVRSYLPYLYWGETEEFKWERFVWPPILNYTVWPFFVPLVYQIKHHYPLFGKVRLKNRLISVGFLLLIALTHEVLTNVLWFTPMHFLDIYEFNEEALNWLKGSIPSATVTRIIEYLIIYGLFEAIDYYRQFKSKQTELALMEAQLANARLNALKMQLHPHFLFNTLNAISSLMEIDVKKAQRMMARLGDLLRTILDQGQRDLITLQEEVDYIDSYLSIEEIRFSDRLKITYEIEDDALDCAVPNLILQPLVENAIKHGFGDQMGESELKIAAKIIANGQKLLLTVSDNGKGSQQALKDLMKQGIGLKNTHDRLHQLFEDRFELVRKVEEEGFSIQIIIPLEDDTNKDFDR